MNYRILQEHGIDYQKGLARCMDDEAFYEEFISMFLVDDTFERAKAAFEKKDYDLLFKCMHELKGICGNAAMTKLQGDVSELVELLRAGGTEDEISDLFMRIEPEALRARKGVLLSKE